MFSGKVWKSWQRQHDGQEHGVGSRQLEPGKKKEYLSAQPSSLNATHHLRLFLLLLIFRVLLQTADEEKDWWAPSPLDAPVLPTVLFCPSLPLLSPNTAGYLPLLCPTLQPSLQKETTKNTCVSASTLLFVILYYVFIQYTQVRRHWLF